MKKSDFLYEVRRRIENKSLDAVKKSLLDFARYISRDEYEDMLLLLDRNDDISPAENGIDLLTGIRQLCEKAENGEYEFSWEYEEYYGYGGYWDSDGEEILNDCNGLAQEIDPLLRMSVFYVREKRYAQALEALDQLFSIEIDMDEGFDCIDIMTLFNNDLIKVEESNVLRHYAYAALMVLRDSARVEKLFEIACLSSFTTKMQDITRVGTDEIPEREEFAEQWVKFLIKQKLRYQQVDILIDAVKYSGGTKALNAFVKEYGEKYPTAYIELITEYIAEKQYGDAVAAASEGLTKLNVISETRTAIADLLLEAGNLTKDEQIIRTAVWEGFRSSLDLSHFISLRRLNDENLVSLAIEYMDENYKKDSSAVYYCIHFLNGDYDLVWDACKKDKKFLGWSTSEKGKLLPLFAALLTEGQTVMPCTKKLIENTYLYGNVFEDFIQILTSSLKKLSESDYQKYYDWCVKEAAGRVDAIVKGQFRGSYHKASMLVVSMAEVIRSKGGDSDAIKFIKSYKEKYPRHSSFHSCLLEDISLGNFGMSL